MSGAPGRGGAPQRMTRPSTNAPVPGRTTSMVPSRAGSAGPAQGAGRIMFRPVITQRRRTPVPAEAPKQEEPQQVPKPSAKGRVRTSNPRPQTEMSASGPFALGPTNRVGSQARSAGPRTTGPTITAPSAPREYQGARDDDVDFIDMRQVQELDVMAPQSLLEPPKDHFKQEVKSEQGDSGADQALDLSESEADDDETDIARRFSSTLESGNSEQNIFLFQFPQVFPQFSTVPGHNQAKNEDGVELEVGDAGVALAPTPEGQIGRLDIYPDGRAVLMVGDVPFELNDGCETSFLQQLMLLDRERQQAVCVGELDNKFVATPQLEYLLREDEARMQALGS